MLTIRRHSNAYFKHGKCYVKVYIKASHAALVFLVQFQLIILEAKSTSEYTFNIWTTYQDIAKGRTLLLSNLKKSPRE